MQTLLNILNQNIKFLFFADTFFLVKKVSKKTSQKYAPRSSRNSTIFTFRYRYTKILNSRFTPSLLAFLAVQRSPTHLEFILKEYQMTLLNQL